MQHSAFLDLHLHIYHNSETLILNSVLSRIPTFDGRKEAVGKKPLFNWRQMGYPPCNGPHRLVKMLGVIHGSWD